MVNRARPRQCPPGGPRFVSPYDRHRKDGNAERASKAERARLESLKPAIQTPPAFGENHDGLTGLKEPHAFTGGPRVRRLDLDGKRAKPTDQPCEPVDTEQDVPGHVVHAPAYRNGDQHWVRKRHVVRNDDHRPGSGDVVNPFETNTEIGSRTEPQGGAEHIKDRRPHASILPWG